MLNKAASHCLAGQFLSRSPMKKSRNIVNLNKSLEELENDFWDEPSINSSVALKCHTLRKLPISKLSTEDLRLLIGQKFGLIFLAPLALDLLESNPLVAGEMYKGDLLANVSAIPEEFWCKNPELNNRLVEIANEIAILSETINNELLPILSRFKYK